MEKQPKFNKQEKALINYAKKFMMGGEDLNTQIESESVYLKVENRENDSEEIEMNLFYRDSMGNIFRWVFDDNTSNWKARHKSAEVEFLNYKLSDEEKELNN